MEPLNYLLQKSTQKSGLSDIYDAGALVPRWWEIVGVQVAGKTAPLRIKDKTLLIRTSSPGWSHQLSLLKPAIIKKLKQAGFEIEDLRFIFNEKEIEKPRKKRSYKTSAPDFSNVPETIDSEKLKLAIASYLGAKKGIS